jgi:formamidopyrimidine-DNA glycosylase
VAGRKILNAEFRKPRVLNSDADWSAEFLRGRRIQAVERYGKFIVFRLAPAGFLLVHLGMTGKLLLNAPLTKHSHVIFTLDRGVLQYEDSRQFGRVEVSEELPARVVKLGPDALEVDLETFVVAVRKRKIRMKALLLNQQFVRGIGNIYADEALFRAGIHPLALGTRLAIMWIPRGIADRFRISTASIRGPGWSAWCVERRSSGHWWRSVGRTFVPFAKNARFQLRKKRFHEILAET